MSQNYSNMGKSIVEILSHLLSSIPKISDNSYVYLLYYYFKLSRLGLFSTES